MILRSPSSIFFVSCCKLVRFGRAELGDVAPPLTELQPTAADREWDCRDERRRRERDICRDDDRRDTRTDVLDRTLRVRFDCEEHRCIASKVKSLADATPHRFDLAYQHCSQGGHRLGHAVRSQEVAAHATRQAEISREYEAGFSTCFVTSGKSPIRRRPVISAGYPPTYPMPVSASPRSTAYACRSASVGNVPSQA